MRKLLMGFCTAFSLYSAVPVPQVRWNRDSMRYALCFFPLVGLLVGALLWLWHLFAVAFSVVPGLFAAVAVLIPVIVSGGIHLDGLIDTADALSSRQPPERRLEIMRDAHTGAFGVIWCGCYLLLQYGLWQQLYGSGRFVLLPAAGAVLSRALNALSITTFPCAKNSGLVYAFSGAAARKAAVCASMVYTVVAFAAGIFVSIPLGIALMLVCAGYFFWHRRFCLRGFAGNTGDLAGFLLQNVEMLCLIAAALGVILSGEVAP